jgi:tRNA A-37 threonylcarbamoyl transferase component Bud32
VFCRRVLYRGQEDEYPKEALKGRLNFATQVTRAVDALHDRGVIHGHLDLGHVMVVDDCIYGGVPALTPVSDSAEWLVDFKDK